MIQILKLDEQKMFIDKNYLRPTNHPWGK
jgi:hypothetical protein